MPDRDVTERVERLEDELWRTHPDNPGAVLRLDRIERLLSVMLKVGGAIGGLGLAWKVLEVIGEVVQAKVGP